jgi:nucleoside-diphosphate-sugar epimerase
MRIFLTGGSGFVGHHILRRLTGEGHVVRALARSAATAQQLEDAGAEVVRGDLVELGPPGEPPGWLSVALADADAVVHAAAHMQFWGRDQTFVERNLEPTVELYRAAVDAGVRRFVLLSAASVSSGSQRAAVVDETTDPGRPNIAYSRVKLRTERELLAAPHGETTLVILRPPFVWGVGMRATLQGFVDSVHAGRFAWIDHGRHTMDMVHVDNLAYAVALALVRGEHGLTCYVTDGNPMSVREFVSALLATQRVQAGDRSVPRPVASAVATILQAGAKAVGSPTAPPLTPWVVTFLGRDRSYDISQARAALGYAPVVSLEDGLRDMTRHAAQSTRG